LVVFPSRGSSFNLKKSDCCRRAKSKKSAYRPSNPEWHREKKKKLWVFHTGFAHEEKKGGEKKTKACPREITFTPGEEYRREKFVYTVKKKRTKYKRKGGGDIPRKNRASATEPI